ncbi:MAG: MBL fold metallo-hydrolase [Campylobacterales bacterium]|nr:MBL fold metallo-hydrolase [Campylobacterales bacterium]
MKIQSHPMGDFQTQCYIVSVEGKDLIIDPGIGATKWVKDHVKNPVAILNTHGHFDHVWSNQELKETLKLPIYIQKADAFMLLRDPIGRGVPASHADVEVVGDQMLDIEGIKVKYIHFPGHTPGSSVIEVGSNWFCGDFLFARSIGRWDFPYSNAQEMVASLHKAKQIQDDFTLYPGHGSATTLKAEQKTMDWWIREVKSTIR